MIDYIPNFDEGILNHGTSSGNIMGGDPFIDFIEYCHCISTDKLTVIYNDMLIHCLRSILVLFRNFSFAIFLFRNCLLIDYLFSSNYFLINYLMLFKLLSYEVIPSSYDLIVLDTLSVLILFFTND